MVPEDDLSQGEAPKIYTAEEIRAMMRTQKWKHHAGNIYTRMVDGVQEFRNFHPPEDQKPEDRATRYRELIAECGG